MQRKNFLILIGGASGSGKTTIVEEIFKLLDKEIIKEIIILKQDDYYRDNSHLTMVERNKINYDHPNQFDFKLLIKDVKSLIMGENIQKPLYNFKKHIRMSETEKINGKIANIIILEGIMALQNDIICSLSNLKIYVHTDADICLIRRIRRDIAERNRSLDSILIQYEKSVKPMYLKYILPSKKNADIIIPEGKENKPAIDLLSNKLKNNIIN